jgi:PAS domain-containing protein
MNQRRRSVSDHLDRVPDAKLASRLHGDLRSRDEYARLVDSVGGIIWEADAQTFRFLFVSAQAEVILGFPRQQWLDEPVSGSATRIRTMCSAARRFASMPPGKAAITPSTIE